MGSLSRFAPSGITLRLSGSPTQLRIKVTYRRVRSKRLFGFALGAIGKLLVSDNTIHLRHLRTLLYSLGRPRLPLHMEDSRNGFPLQTKTFDPRIERTGVRALRHADISRPDQVILAAANGELGTHSECKEDCKFRNSERISSPTNECSDCRTAFSS
jgi:hypothetical protein